MSDNQLPLFKRKTFPVVSTASPIELRSPTGESTDTRSYLTPLVTE